MLCKGKGIEGDKPSIPLLRQLVPGRQNEVLYYFVKNED